MSIFPKKLLRENEVRLKMLNILVALDDIHEETG